MKDIKYNNIKNLILDTIEIYNKYRTPERTAEFVAIEKNDFIINFKGFFHSNSVAREYFEDFIYELKKLNKTTKVQLLEVKTIESNKFRVRYRFIKALNGLDENLFFQEFLNSNGLSFEDYLGLNSCTKDVVKFHFRTWLFEKNQTN